MNEDKVRKKYSCWCVGTIYDPRELLGVCTVGPGIGRGVTSGIRADSRGFMSVCGLGVRVYGAWCMWAQSGYMARHMTTLDTITPRPIPRPAVLTPHSSLGSYIVPTDQHGSFCTLCPYSCASEKTSRSVTHPKLLQAKHA